MVVRDVADSAAVRRDVPVEAPVLPKVRGQKFRASTTRYAVDSIVRAHDAGCVAPVCARHERWKVSVFQILLRNHCVCVVPALPVRVLHTVRSVVLAACRRLNLGRILSSLEPSDKPFCVIRVNNRVFARCLLPAAPPRVLQNATQDRRGVQTKEKASV